MKDNFLLKKTQIEVFKELSDEDAGKLIKGIFNYVNNGDSELTGYMNIIFIPIKNEIDKNEERYEEVCKKNKKNGNLGGRPKKGEVFEETQKNPTVISKTEKNPTVFSKTQQNPKNPINHNHNHIHISSINNHNSNNLEIIKQIIDYLNIKVGSKFKNNTKSTQQKIIARLNEGYVLDDFIVVIDKKTDEWINNPEFSKYLCPETLFGTKFEKYLNQKNIKNSHQGKVDEQMEYLKGVYDGTIKIG